MANRIATLLANTKTRSLVLVVIGILAFGVVLAVFQAGPEKEAGSSQRVSKTTEVPNQVESTPGAPVTRKYQELQEKANMRGAEEAAKKGTTFIPKIIGQVADNNGADFDKQLSAAFDDLGGKCSKETVEKLRKQGMDTTKIILELKSYGCSSAAIASLFKPDEIAAALLAMKDCNAPENIKGCDADAAKKLKDAGYDAKKIAATFKNNGCDFAQTAKALKANGATIEEIATALKESGADATQVASALSKAGYSKLDILPALTKAGFSSIEVARAISNLDNEDSGALAQQNEAARLAAQQEAQQLAAFSQQRQSKIQELVQAMEAQKKSAMDVWNNVPQQAMIIGEWQQKKEAAAAQAAQNASSGGGRIGTGTSTGTENKGIILKAGSILFATLDTAVNSDEPGPVMATIVSGSLKGAKLLGTMTTNTDAENISLNFSAINMPSEAQSMGISAVAIDPDTARTALATDVDRHYLLRWGSLFASSFVSGYASAVANAGQTSSTVIGPSGVTTTTTSPSLSGKQQLFEGIGAFGTKWSEVVAKNFDRDPTITIDQGTGIGVLVTSDLQYGTDPIFYTPPTTTTAAAAAQSTSANAANSNSLSPEQAAALISNLQKQQSSATSVPGQVATTTTGGTK